MFAACIVTFVRSWLLKLPDCMVPNDLAPDFPASRARMRAGVCIAFTSPVSLCL